MGNYPPKLERIIGTPFGSLLILSDGREVPINISAGRLSQALVGFGRPPLDELLASRSLAIYADHWETTAEEWGEVSTAVRASPVAATAFGDVPPIWGTFGQPAVVVRGLPHRVYGGLEQALYTSHPFHFRSDPNRPAPWVRALLGAPGGRLINTWVHRASGRVEVVSDVLPGHYLEEVPTLGRLNGDRAGE